MRRLGRYITRALAAIGFLYVLVSVTPIDRWWIRFLAGAWNDPKGEVLIVLGADSVKDVIGAASYWRSVYAVRVWRDGGFREVIVCGGPAEGEAAISERMRDFMVAQGVPPEAIRVETASHSTRENALYSKALLDAAPGRKILLTSDYHMFRAYRVFRKAGIDRGATSDTGRGKANQLLADSVASVRKFMRGDDQDRVLFRARLDLKFMKRAEPPASWLAPLSYLWTSASSFGTGLRGPRCLLVFGGP